MTTTYHPIRSLVWKEWREQRWRFVLSALVLTTLSASMVRAQLIPTAESVAIIFGPLGLVLCVFMSMGAVPPERAAGTWHFLVTQPMSFGRIVIVKWAVGAAGLVLTLLLAGFAAYILAADRDPSTFSPEISLNHYKATLPPNTTILWEATGKIAYLNPSVFLIGTVVSACLGYLALYSFLYWWMLRARNELHAGLAGILLTVVTLAWAAQYLLIGKIYEGPVAQAAWVSTLLNPLSPLIFLFQPYLFFHALALILSPAVWVCIPVFRWRRRIREVEE